MAFADFFAPYKLEANRPYGPLARQVLDVYTPKTGVTSATKVVVFFPGGGYQPVTTYDKTAYKPIADSLVRAGYIVVVANYRLWDWTKPSVNQWPTQLTDGVAVVAWIRTNKPNRPIILMGHSAGAGIAGHLIYDNIWATPGVVGWIGLGAPFSFTTINRPDDLPWEFFPQEYSTSRDMTFHVSPADRKGLLIVGADDEYDLGGAMQLSFVDLLRANSIPVVSHVLPGIDHIEVIQDVARFGSATRNHIVSWLKSA